LTSSLTKTQPDPQAQGVGLSLENAMSRKSHEQINNEINALRTIKPTVRKTNAFHEDNHEAIDAQIAVLEERMSHDDVYDTWGDEDTDEFSQHLLDAALRACDWMSGDLAESEGSPSSDWS
jgi:hypothetical protein